MADVTIRLTDNPFKVTLTGKRAGRETTVMIDHVRLSTTANSSTVTADLKFENEIAIPDLLLKADGNELVLRSPSEADDNNAAGALAELRRKLAKQSITLTGQKFFGLPGGTALTRGSLSIAIDGPEGITLTARAIQEIEAEIELADFAMATVNGRLTFEVQVTQDDVLAAIDMILPDRPDLGFSLPEFTLPALTFDGLDIHLPTMTALKLPVPNWLPDDLIKVSGGDPFTVKITNDNLQITANSDIHIQVKGTDAIIVKNFEVTQSNGDVSVKGDVSTHGTIPINLTLPFGGGAFPLRGGLHVESASYTTNGTDVAITWTIPRLWIETTNDPETRIAFKIKLTSTTKIADGETTWMIDTLEILDLSGTVRLPEIGRLDAKITIKFGALWGDTEEFLRRLLRLIAALSRWMAEKLGPIPGLLAELAEYLGSLLADVMRMIIDEVDEVSQYVTLELRLDAATLRPVQLIVTINGVDASSFRRVGESFLRLEGDLSIKPALILDFENNWQGLALLSDAQTPPSATLSTNLWMADEIDKSSSIPPLRKEKAAESLIAVKATMQSENNIVLAALQHGQAKFFQKFGDKRGARITKTIDGKDYVLSTVGALTDLSDLVADDIEIEFDADKLKDKLLALMPQGPAEGDGLLKALGQYARVGEVDHNLSYPEIELTVPITLVVGEMEVEVTPKLTLDLRTLHSKVTTGEDVFIEGAVEETLFGLELRGTPNDENHMFRMSFVPGDASLSLAKGASIEVVFDQLSESGPPLTLKATVFEVGRGGLDLTAVTPDDPIPVRLAGLDQPFRFTNGSLVIEGGELKGGTISGHGPMPPALIGEANAEIDIVFGRRNNRLTVTSANAKLEKEGEPLYSTGTKFKVTLDALGLAFREPEFGPVQFFFELWGSASFEPAPGEFDGGILKNIRSVAIKLDGAPLAGDGRELIKHISFLVELDPPLRESLFDIFGFELRGIAFYPASKGWPDTPPAIGLTGQVSFLEAGDVVSSEISFHELLLAPPEPGGSIPLPRIRADGLSVLLRVGGIAQVEATAVAVDGTIPSIYAPVALPADVTADGFLASGRIDILGLGAFGGAMGFLELRKEGIDRVKHAMFLYGQAEKLTERIDTPIGPLFIREAGFGFGKNYTLTAMAAADEARSPRELVKALDEVSKIQGNLTNFNAWTPQYDKDAITIALRGMISMTATSSSSASYDSRGEKELANPLLMDIVLGLRTDFTFFANIRGWLAYNYNDWFIASSGATFKERPTLRGYLYFSVPRKELLARFVSDPTGMIGKHPELDKNLVKAIQSVRFSATLYIRPGLYHCEFGWPYELGFTMGEPGGNFHLDVSGGLVLRIEDATMLYGLAFKASGHMEFGGSVGNDNFGASAVARADFLLGAKFIAYIAPLNPKDTLFYGEIYLNLSLRIGVNIWMSFKIFRKRFTLRIGFSIGLTISVAAEVVLSGEGVGARIHAAVGVSGFGRTLSVGVGFSFGDSKLASARARVARFMDLGLGIDPPKENQLAAPAPAPEVRRETRAAASDDRLDTPVPQLPDQAPPDPDDADPVTGRTIEASNFWALLFSGGTDDEGKQSYLMMLVPRDRTGGNDAGSTFFAEPFEVTKDENGVVHSRISGAHDYELTIAGDWVGLQHLSRQGDVFEPSTLASGAHNLDAQLGLGVGQCEFGSLDLNALMAECFLDPKTGNYPYTEPFPILHGMPNRETPQSARDQRIRQASRNVSDKQLKASLIAEEKRSALITKAGESAFEMAAVARERVGQPHQEKWTFDADGLAAPDFGLTFVVTEDQITSGDPFTGTNFTLKKRVQDGNAWEMKKGEVALLNHPADSYEKKQPGLEDEAVEVDQDGLKLLWDLEPAFGRSGNVGFEKDPETLLAHYRIERSFEGSVNTWKADFLTRTATPLKYEEDVDTLTTTRTRARMHLCDDFSLGNVPEDLRALIIGAPIPSGRSPVTVWNEAFGEGTTEASVVYKVVAVDIMGTETGLRVLEKTLTRPPLRAPVPLNVEMLVDYQAGLPAFGGKVQDPHFEFAVDFSTEDAWRTESASIYQMRIRSHRLRGGGQYGADALDDSQNRPGQSDIDNFRDGQDQDLFLVPLEANAGGLTVEFRVAPKGDDEIPEGKIEPKRCGVFRTLEEAMAATSQSTQDARNTLARALQVPLETTKANELRASRVFLRNLGGKDEIEQADLSGPWLIVQTQLVVPPVGDMIDAAAGIKPLTYSATVELLETPVSAPFLALKQDQIERSAGRLELVFPNAAHSFGDFIDKTKENRTLRRLDPDLRSAIRLDFNASAARRDGPDLGVLNGLVGGYDIFAASPARLRMRGDENDEITTATVIEEARKRATVKVLPRSLAGLFPDKLPDFRSIDVRYPSETLRTAPGARGKRPRARWYSNAESLVAFPEQCLRRSLFPVTDETLISALLDEFRASKVTAELKPVAAPPGVKLEDWAKLLKIASKSDLAPSPETNEDVMPVLAADGTIGLKTPRKEGVKASELRAMLRGLVLTDNETLRAAYRKWRRDGSDPESADAYRVKVTITALETQPDRTRSQTVEVNLASPLHPVIADTLDTLCYRPVKNTSDGTPPTSGQVYRAYEVELEPVPQQETKGFEALLDAHGPSGDPYGWSALRALGLAAGFRLYDIDEAQFLTGGALFKHVNACFTAALERYHRDGMDLGHPFVELVDLPDTFMGISAVDDRSDQNQNDVGRIIDGDTAILQIGLRPRPAQQRQGAIGAYYAHYLAVTVENQANLKDAADNPEITFPEGFIFDSVGLPDATGQGRTRFADPATRDLFSPGDTEIANTVIVDLNRLKARSTGDICFILRATRITRSLPLEFTQAVKDALKDAGLALGDEHTHPGDAPSFETFPALEPPMLAFQQGRQHTDDPFTPLETLFEWLPPDHLPKETHELGDPGTDRSPLDALLPIVARVSEWTARFLPHGAAQAKADDEGVPKVSVAFAALTSEESHSRVPDVNGRVSAFFIDPARLGREHYFAIRPFGRYASIETMVSGQSERPITLDDGLPEAWQDHFAAVSLNRTKPPEPPAILATRATEKAVRNNATGVEVIVARTPDQIASEANLDAERALQGGWTGLELRAHYPALGLARTLWEDEDFDPFLGFDEDHFQPANDDPETHVQIFTPQDLEAMRQAAPDAWRGSIRFDLSGLPHFFDTVAMVHQSAGAVVSEISAVPLPRFGRVPNFPPFAPAMSPTDPRLNENWGIADRPVWSVEHEEDDNKAQKARVAFDLPMMRNLDLMPLRDLLAWTDGKAPEEGAVYYLPDAVTSYRISTEPSDFSTTVPQIDLLPAQSANTRDTMFSASLAGDRFETIVEKTTLVAAQPPGTGTIQNWRLMTTAEVPGTVPIPAKPALPDLAFDDAAAFTALPPSFDAARWAEWAPVRSFGFTVLAPDPTAIAAVVGNLQPFAGAAYVDALIARLQDPDLAAGDRVEGWLPLGLAKVDLPTELSANPAEIGAFEWPGTLDPLGLSDADAALFRTYAEALDTDAKDAATECLKALQENWGIARKLGATALGANYRATGVTDPQDGMTAPFAHFRMIRYTRADGQLLTADGLQALIDGLQSLTGADRYVIGQAVQSLRQVPADSVGYVAVPLPVGTAPPAVTGHDAAETDETFTGLHWLPTTQTLIDVGSDNTLRRALFRVTQSMIFGQQSRVRLTGFAGSDGAVSVGIAQKGEQT